MNHYPSFHVVVSEGIASMNASGRCKDGSDDSIASSSVAQQAVLKSIGRLEAIQPTAIQVAITSTDKAEAFEFSRVLKIPRLVMEISSGRLALTNISLLVSNTMLVSEDVLIGLPVLRHVSIYSRTLLVRNLATLDGTDSSSVTHPSISTMRGSLGRLMIARHKRVTRCEPINHDSNKPSHAPQPHPDRPSENYFTQKLTKIRFPFPTLWKWTKSRRRKTSTRTSMT